MIVLTSEYWWLKAFLLHKSFKNQRRKHSKLLFSVHSYIILLCLCQYTASLPVKPFVPEIGLLASGLEKRALAQGLTGS